MSGQRQAARPQQRRTSSWRAWVARPPRPPPPPPPPRPPCATSPRSRPAPPPAAAWRAARSAASAAPPPPPCRAGGGWRARGRPPPATPRRPCRASRPAPCAWAPCGRGEVGREGGVRSARVLQPLITSRESGKCRGRGVCANRARRQPWPAPPPQRAARLGVCCRPPAASPHLGAVCPCPPTTDALTLTGLARVHSTDGGEPRRGRRSRGGRRLTGR